MTYGSSGNKPIYPEIEFDGKSYDDPSSISSAFANHLYDVYNPKENDSFDSQFFHDIENSYTNLETIFSSSPETFPGGAVTVDEISHILRDLKRRKAPGLDRIQNEHFIYGGIQLSKCISHLFNAVIKIGRIPSCWKKDLIVPIYKGNNKPRKSPDSYRPIALLPCLLKIFEKLLLTRIRTHIQPLINFPNQQQQGFQQNLGCTTASFNLQETIYHNIEHGSPVLAAFLDTQKAFDTVWRHGLMYKLHRLGISGRLWSLVNDCHVNTMFSIVVNQVTSDWFPISQGVRQGGVLSAFLYLVFIDELLHEIQKLCINVGIFNITSSNPTLADDICCVALTPQGLQNVLCKIYEYSRKWRFKFNANKSSVLHFYPKRGNHPDESTWNLGKDVIRSSKEYTHLGILLNSTFDPSNRTSNACMKGRQTYFALKSSNQLNPITISKLYKKVVLPSILYGSELWCDLRKKDVETLNTFQHFVAKHAMDLHKQTRSDMCESLLGLLPIIAEIDIKKLQFFGRLCKLDTTYLTKRIFLTRLFSYMLNPSAKHRGFIQDIIRILTKYSLYPALAKYMESGTFPSKSEWKRSVRSSVTSYHSNYRQQRMQADPDFARFLILCNGKSPTLIWNIPRNNCEILLCKFIIKLWTLRDTPPESCSLCARSFTNVFEHLSTTCPETSLYRDAWWETIIEDFDISLSAELCGLPQGDIYLFILGATNLVSNLTDSDLPELHLLNFRFMRDAAAMYHNKLRASL